MKDDDTISDRKTLRENELEGHPETTGETLSGTATEGGDGRVVLGGRYRVVKRLGEGGMGSVWLAEDLRLDGRLVALKMLPAVLANKKGAYRQVKQEALVAMKLSHPNIATVRAFEEDEGGAPFLVMDYIEGEGLDEILSERGPLGEEETLKMLGAVAAALDYAHSQGVVHRDVKPGNVMVRKDGTPFVLDFGIAREIQETMTRVTGKISSGTLLYMSPEQLRGRAPKADQDVYSFAAMAYECLAGHPPFYRGGVEDQIKNEPPEELEKGVVSEGLRKGIMAGLAKVPEERPGSCMGVLGRDEATKREWEKREAEEARRKREEEVFRAQERARAEEEQRRKREKADRLARERARAEEDERRRAAEALEAERAARSRAEAEARDARRKAQAEELAAQRAQEARGRAAGWAWFLAIVLVVGGLAVYGWWQQEHETLRAQDQRLQQETEAQRKAPLEVEAKWKAEAEARRKAQAEAEQKAAENAKVEAEEAAKKEKEERRTAMEGIGEDLVAAQNDAGKAKEQFEKMEAEKRAFAIAREYSQGKWDDYEYFRKLAEEKASEIQTDSEGLPYRGKDGRKEYLGKAEITNLPDLYRSVAGNWIQTAEALKQACQNIENSQEFRDLREQRNRVAEAMNALKLLENDPLHAPAGGNQDVQEDWKAYLDFRKQAQELAKGLKFDSVTGLPLQGPGWDGMSLEKGALAELTERLRTVESNLNHARETLDNTYRAIREANATREAMEAEVARKKAEEEAAQRRQAAQTFPGRLLTATQIEAFHKSGRDARELGITITKLPYGGPHFEFANRPHMGRTDEKPMVPAQDSSILSWFGLSRDAKTSGQDTPFPAIEATTGSGKNLQILVDTSARQSWLTLDACDDMSYRPFKPRLGEYPDHVSSPVPGYVGVGNKLVIGTQHVECPIFYVPMASGPLGPLARLERPADEPPLPSHDRVREKLRAGLRAVMGTEMLKNFDWVRIDFPRRRVRLSSNGVYKPPVPEAVVARLPMLDWKGRPAIAVRIDGRPVTAVIDTAGDFELSLPDSDLRGGYNGDVQLQIGALPTTSVIPQFVVPAHTHTGLGLPPDFPARIGTRILERYAVTLDFKDRRVLFEDPELAARPPDKSDANQPDDVPVHYRGVVR